MAAKFNQSPSTSVFPPFKKNEENLTSHKKNEDSSQPINIKTPGKIQSNFLQKTPPQFMSTLENTLKLPTMETPFKTPDRIKTQTQQFSSSRANEKNNENSGGNNKNNLEAPVQTKISVKEMSKNLSMINLPFRNYPGPPKPKIAKEEEETKENESFRNTAPLNNDYNQVI